MEDWMGRKTEWRRLYLCNGFEDRRLGQGFTSVWVFWSYSCGAGEQMDWNELYGWAIWYMALHQCWQDQWFALGSYSEACDEIEALAN